MSNDLPWQDAPVWRREKGTKGLSSIESDMVRMFRNW